MNKPILFIFIITNLVISIPPSNCLTDFEFYCLTEVEYNCNGKYFLDLRDYGPVILLENHGNLDFSFGGQLDVPTGLFSDVVGLYVNWF